MLHLCGFRNLLQEHLLVKSSIHYDTFFFYDCVCGKKLVLSFLCKDVYPFIFTKFFLPQFCFSLTHSDRHAPHCPWGPTAPCPLGLPRDTGSPGSSPVKVSSGPRNQWLGYFTSWMSSPPPRHHAQNIPEASSRGASPEPLQEDLPCPQTPSDLESMLTCYV